MVMEASPSPSPQSVGREFVRQYYTLLNKAPAHLHRFYNNYSSFVHGGLDAPNRETLPVVGQKQIHNRIQQLNFRDCHAKISQVDAQATLGNGVVVQVTGELSNAGAPMRRFTQTFVLAAQSPKKYYVHNDIFRYQDVVFSDEEGEGSGRSDAEEEDAAAGGYFPPAFPPAPFPAPPHAQLVSLPASPHLNGHPHDDPARHLAAALQADPSAMCPATPAGTTSTLRPVSSAGTIAPAAAAVPEREEEPAPEPEREPTPPPQQPTPQPMPQPAAAAPPEPKTYANLLKSGSSASTTRGSPPAPPAPVPAPSSAPAPASHEPRARPPRSAQPQQQAGNQDGGRRYSDAQQLFLGNLPHSATEESLRAIFSRFGPVAELRVHSKPAAPGAPRHPNYGFITYETAQAAADCLLAAANEPLYFPGEGGEGGEGAGVKLNVEEKKTRGREPPRRRPLSSHRASFQPRQNFRR
ncbi:ras GTPase-activating protein-binding protein 2 [Danaus plexippus]|nr:ras GTPase-activating protein-binding protein 2 [Danaus plexippus]